MKDPAHSVGRMMKRILIYLRIVSCQCIYGKGRTWDSFQITQKNVALHNGQGIGFGTSCKKTNSQSSMSWSLWPYYGVSD